MQQKTSRMCDAGKRIGLKINTLKTKVMKMNDANNHKIKIDNEEIEEVDKFTYLGAIVSNEGGSTEDLKNRIGKARSTFARLRNIWKSKKIRRGTKIRLYKTLVLPVLLYGSETWKMNKSNDNAVNVFHHDCLRCIMNINWQDRIRTTELLTRSKTKPMSVEIKRRRWKFIGHILRQDRFNDSNIALTWRPEGRRRGRPKTTWRRTVEVEREEAGWSDWGAVRRAAADRVKWRRSVEALCATPARSG